MGTIFPNFRPVYHLGREFSTAGLCRQRRVQIFFMPNRAFDSKIMWSEVSK